jgi:hypothetical protein
VRSPYADHSGRSVAGITGSNSAGGMDVCCECCVLSGRGLLRQADHTCRGVLPTVVCLTECDWGNVKLKRPWEAVEL